MKLIIDTEKRLVTVIHAESFEAFVAKMKELFPNDYNKWGVTCTDLKDVEFIRQKQLPIAPTEFKYPSFERRK